MSKKYDFDFLNKPSESGEPEQELEKKEPARPGFRITRCCGNCKFFWYEAGKSRRGYCRQPYIKERTPDTKRGERFDVNDIKTNWLHAHTTNTCEKHQFQSKAHSIGLVSKWVEKVFNADGSLAEEEEFDV